MLKIRLASRRLGALKCIAYLGRIRDAKAKDEAPSEQVREQIMGLEISGDMSSIGISQRSGRHTGWHVPAIDVSRSEEARRGGEARVSDRPAGQLAIHVICT